MSATGHDRGTRSWWPLGVIAAIVFSVTYFTRVPQVPAVACDVDVAASQADLVMLSAEWCGYCARARHFFVDRGVNYCEYDIERTAQGRTMYERSGIRGIPVILIDDDVIVGFNRHEIEQALVVRDLLPL